jgi:hypothetical protein
LISDQPSFAEVKTDTNTGQELKDETKQSSSQTLHSSELKTADLTEAAGQKTFSRQLAQQVSDSQFNRQMTSTSKQTEAWKHHHLTLNDGNAIHIASRTENGALQLQLNAGNGQLGKILQQHLQEIQQHVQQQLNVDINLQLKDFGSQQQNGQPPGKSTLKKPKEKTGTGERTPIEGDYQVETQQLRYFGFNRNEWTA